MSTDWIEVVAAWLLGFTIHGTVILAAVAVGTRLLRVPDGVAESLWRFALLGGLATATLQVAAGGAWLAPIPVLDPAPPQLGAASLPAPELAAVLPAPVVDAAPPGPELPRVAVVVVGLAALAALLGLARLGLRRIALNRLLADRRPLVAGSPARRALDRLCAGAGVRRPVRLCVSASLEAPVAFGLLRPEICVPRRALGALPPGVLDAMLAHELAHVVRRDPLWLEIAHTLAALFPWQPLLRVAARRLRALAEFRCDALGARLTAPVDVADCLVQVAGWIGGDGRAVAAEGLVGMTVHREGLAARVDRLLDPDATPTLRRPQPAATLLAALGAVGVLGAALPGAGVALPARAEEPPVARAVDSEAGELRELLALLDIERDALAREVGALRAAVAGRPPDPESRALLDAIDQRLRSLDARRRALGELVETLAVARPRTAPMFPLELETNR